MFAMIKRCCVVVVPHGNQYGMLWPYYMPWGRGPCARLHFLISFHQVTRQVIEVPGPVDIVRDVPIANLEVPRTVKVQKYVDVPQGRKNAIPYEDDAVEVPLARVVEVVPKIEKRSVEVPTERFLNKNVEVPKDVDNIGEEVPVLQKVGAGRKFVRIADRR